MPFALLGDIAFDLLKAPASLEGHFGVDYAEHARIGGKPRLQRVASQLDKWSLQLQFHFSFCDPQTELDALVTAMTAGQAMSFVLGTGKVLGNFVIDNISQTTRETFADGLLMAIAVGIELREFYVADQASQVSAAAKPGVRKAGQLIANPALRTATQVTGSPTFTSFRGVLTAAKQAAGAYRSAKDVIAAARQMTTNPTLAINRVVGASSQLVQLAGLQDQVQALAPFASRSDVAGVMQLGSDVSGFARTSQGRLATITTSNAPGVLGAVANDLGNIGTTFDNGAGGLARLTAMVAVRSPALTA